jgi:hypothetical protein
VPGRGLAAGAMGIGAEAGADAVGADVAGADADLRAAASVVAGLPHRAADSLVDRRAGSAVAADSRLVVDSLVDRRAAAFTVAVDSTAVVEATEAATGN